jgi:hypothetical protein
MRVRVENHYLSSNSEWDVCDITAMSQMLEITTCDDHGQPVPEDGWQGFGGVLERIPRLVCRDPLSPKGTKIVAGWLRLCSDHKDCIALEDRAMPSRVIDVKNPQAPKLVETKSKHGQYVILSHCWGQEPDMAQHRAKISAGYFPGCRNCYPSTGFPLPLDRCALHCSG